MHDGRLYRRLRVTLPYLAVAVAAACVFYVVARRQQPITFFDSQVLTQSAAQPWSWSHLFYPKPPLVPLVYRIVGNGPAAITTFQTLFAITAWMLLGAAVARAADRPSIRIAAVTAITVLALAPSRIGYTHAILTESINDSLQALVIAVAVMLLTAVRGEHDRATRGVKVLAGALVALMVPWLWTRDTNAVVALALVVLVVASRRTMFVRERWPIVAAIAVAAMAALVLWSTSVIPPRTNLTVHESMATDFTARGTYSVFNNIYDAAVADPDAFAFFKEHGMPQLAEFVALGDYNEKLFLDPSFTPARQWIVHHGRSTFVAWLLRHPVDRVAQLIGDAWIALGVDHPLKYMPKGWTPGSRWFRGLLDTNRLVIGLVFLVGAFALWPTRRHMLCWLGAMLVITALVGCAASYYGDSIERARHCYGAGQQLLLGFVLAILGRAESLLQRDGG